MRDRTFAAAAAASGWLFLILQAWLDVVRETGRGGTAWAALWNLASYLTILTIVVAAVVFTWAARRERGGSPLVAAAVLYMLVMALLNHILMGGMHEPMGWRWVADFGMHYVTPVLCVAHWVAGEPRNMLRFRHAWAWMSFPLGYGAYAFTRGALGGRYPYWVIDATELGFARALANAGMVLLLYLVLGHLLVLVSRVLGPRPTGGGEDAAQAA